MSAQDPLRHLHELGQQLDSLQDALRDADLRAGVRDIIEMVMMLTQARVGVLCCRQPSMTPYVVAGISPEQLASSEVGDLQSLLQTEPGNNVVRATDEVLSREAQRRGITPNRRIVRACIATQVPLKQMPTRTFFLLGRDARFEARDELVLSRAAGCIAVTLDHGLLLRSVQRDERRFRAMLENSSEGISVLTSDAEVLYISPAVTLIEGFTPEEIIGTRPFERIHPDDLPHVREMMDRIVKHPGGQVTFEVRHRHKNGSWVWLEVLLTNLLHEPAVAGLVGNYRDITQRKRAEEAMLLSQKMDALGRLAGGIAHDFNNLLLAISGNASLALADTAPDHPARESLDQIVAASRRATDLVGQILSYSRQQDPKREAVDLKSIVEEALRLLRPALPALTEIHFNAAPDAPRVYADSSQIIQVIVNLVTNAAHALPDGRGTIELKLEAYEDRRDETADSWPNVGRYARLVVRDNGTGMSPRTIARMFDPFFTTKPPGQGTGLGLSVVHGIIKAHAGSISVESREGEGTTIEVGLPAATAAAVPARNEETPVPAGASECVLYVDDDAAVVSLITRVLERLGYRVDGYRNPAKALDAFRARPARYSAVITDLSMPVMSGFALADEMRSVRPDIPILLMSGYIRPSDREVARAHGIAEIVPKPGTIAELGIALDRLLRARIHGG